MSTMKLLTIIAALLLSTFTYADPDPKKERNRETRILFVLDASASMRKSWEDRGSKWDAAKEILVSKARELEELPNVKIGMRVYGHQVAADHRDCDDTRLEVPIAYNNASNIEQKLSELRPRGITPIAYSLEKAGDDFPDKKGRNIVILITDGDESCKGDPCAIALSLQRSGAVLKPFVIGIAMPEHIVAKYQCFGEFFDAGSPDDFEDDLDIVFNRVLAKTTAQVNLNDINGRPSETNANMTFYDAQTGVPVYNYYHTFNNKGLPDTLPIDPAMHYDIVVHTLPAQRKDSVILADNEHNIINIDAPQGYLDIVLDSDLLADRVVAKLKGIVRQPGDFKTMHIQPFESKEKYIVGQYDIELLTLPRIKMTGIQVDQNRTTTITVPTPGNVTISKPRQVYGAIFMMQDGKMIKLYELSEDLKPEQIALQPGDYRIVYRPRNAKSMHDSIDKAFSVSSGSSQTILL